MAGKVTALAWWIAGTRVPASSVSYAEEHGVGSWIVNAHFFFTDHSPRITDSWTSVNRRDQEYFT